MHPTVNTEPYKQTLRLIASALNMVSESAKGNTVLYNKYEKLKALQRSAQEELNKGEAANLKRVQFIIKLIQTDLQKDLPSSNN